MKNIDGTDSAGKPAPDPDQAAAFLELLRPGGPWSLVAFDPGRGGAPVDSDLITDAGKVREFVVRNSDRRNIYYSLNLTRKVGKAKKEEIERAEYVHADLDPEGEETPAQAKQRWLAALEAFAPAPTIVMDSGNGIQAFWRLAAPAGPDQFADVEARSKAVMRALGAQDSSTFNIDRILRLPGTINHPTATKLKKGRVACLARLLSRSDAAYPLDAFPAPVVPDAKSKHETRRAGTPDDGGHHERNSELELMIRDGYEVDGDRSRGVWRVCCEMVRRGTPDDVIVAALLDRSNGISAHIYDQNRPEAYAAEQVRKARAEVDAEAPTGKRDGTFTVDDFLAYKPAHTFLFLPTGEQWPGTSVNATLGKVSVGKKKVPATSWLDRHRAVEQMTWAPGLAKVIEGRLFAEGGWIERPGARTFNLYRPPPVFSGGDATRAGPWLEHIRRLFTREEDAAHLVRWLAHRVQRPGEKINHAVVLGGGQGIGKDTILEPVKRIIGPWNFTEVGPTHLMGTFNGYVRSVILRINEARDLGDVSRFTFYDRTKELITAPPDVHRCNEKHLREYSVLNVCGVVFTTNYKTDGLYLPAEDRRHFVLWSDAQKDDFEDDYWRKMWGWYENGGTADIAAYLGGLDLSGFDPKAPPRKTEAFWEIVYANRPAEASELAELITKLGSPPALTLTALRRAADDELRVFLTSRANGKAVNRRISDAGYVTVANPDDQRDGLWYIGGRRERAYARADLPEPERLRAVRELVSRGELPGQLSLLDRAKEVI